MEFELEELNDELEELNIELRNIKDINLVGKEITHKKFGNGFFWRGTTFKLECSCRNG